MGKSCLRSGDQAQRLGCVDEVPLRRFPRVNPVLRFKAHGSGKDSTGSTGRPVAGTRLTYGYKTRLSTQRS